MGLSDKYTVLDVCWKVAALRLDEAQEALIEQATAESDVAPRPAPHTLHAALWYASLGLHVFPLQAASKEPLPRSHGFKEATTERQVIEPWFWEDTRNIGIATGGKYDVIDIDGTEGVKSFTDLIKDGADWLAIRAICDTPRGLHLWVPSTGAPNGSFGTGIDYRGMGGYVVVPPSRIEAGIYRWLLPPTL